MPATEPALTVPGRWVPSPAILYGACIHSFFPATRPAEGSGGDGEEDELNPHQVLLEVGDEAYIFELFRPTGHTNLDPPTWYRGYIVSTSPHPRLPLSTADPNPFTGGLSSSSLSEEPQVSVGIFPASHVYIREQLEDTEMSKYAAAEESVPPRMTILRNGRMEPLPEEDEPDFPSPVFAVSNSKSRSKNRASVSSIAGFANKLSTDHQSARISQHLHPSKRGSVVGKDQIRPSPPLPNLKCGDETTTGAEEPLVDEIACAIREWVALLYAHIYRRDYALFNSIKSTIEFLARGRRQLLDRSLSVDETEKLRRELVGRLVRGNVEQGLDVIVRHPTWGGLVDVNSEPIDTDRKGWVSAVRMYAMQVALAYSGTSSDGGLAPPSYGITTQELTMESPSNPRLSVPNFLNLSTTDSTSHDHHSSPPVSSGAKFYHVFLDLRAFVANAADPGETCELYFSLFNNNESSFISEEYCVILSSKGVPAREADGFGKMRALFIELSQNDIQDQIFLVCRIVKNGNMKVGGVGSNNSTASFQQKGYLSHSVSARSDTSSFDGTASIMGGDDEGGLGEGMLSTRGGRESFRRPFGCAVLELNRFNILSTDQTVQESRMPIFVPTNESNFSGLHEDIIASRLSSIHQSPRADHLAVDVRIFHGEVSELLKDNPSLLEDVPLVSRLGFPDVVFPGDQRNEVYLKLWSADFASGGGATLAERGLAQLAAVAGGKNLEVSVEIRTKDGQVVHAVMSRGAGEPNVSRYYSMVFKSNNTPTWGELVKLQIPVELMEQCHVFLTFRNRTPKDRGPNLPVTEKPFAFAYFPLFSDTATFVSDGAHSLMLYRYEKSCSLPQFYFQSPAFRKPGPLPILPPSVAKILIPLRESMIVRTFLVSTRYTQNETLLKLLKWEQSLGTMDEIKEVLTQLRFVSEVEVCKFLRPIFDTLFSILVSAKNHTCELDDLIFQDLVTLLGIVSDRRFNNFKPVVELYIRCHFNCSTASTHIIKSLHQLLRAPADSDSGQSLRLSIKVWDYLFKFVVRSREIQRSKDVGSGVTKDTLESTFKRELSALLSSVNTLMRATSPSSIIGTQTLAIQHFPSILPELAKCFTDEELCDIAIGFGESISTTTKGKTSIWRLIFQNQVVNSVLFTSPVGRAALVPNLVRWLKSSLGKFDEQLLCMPKDTAATRDSARVKWIEGIRLAVGVIAAALDVLQEALVDPAITCSRSLLATEQDSIEYLLSLLPKLLESYREILDEAHLNLDAVERERTQASMIPALPVVFASSFPLALLSRRPKPFGDQETRRDKKEKEERPTLRAGAGEIACVFIILILLAPRKIFVNWLEATLEIEGKDNFSRLLSQIFNVSKSILENEAYDAQWLNINILAHRVLVKMVDPVSVILAREFVPPQSASFTFQTSLWKSFFSMLLKLLASPQLLIEEFSPQKRRAVWRLAGDIRGDGAKVLMSMWEAIGWEDKATEQVGPGVRYGGYQVQFVPGLVEDVLCLCLSHHDEMRTSAVRVLFSMILSEYYLNENFDVIQSEVISKIDLLFQSKVGDEISRAFMVGQLRALFDNASIDDRLREQVAEFLGSVDLFLELLLAVRNLPEGEEYQEDRIVSTLKLMTFIRGIGRTEVFIRYVNRLVTYHVASGSETEAGLVLKLHSDLHEWSLSTFVDAIPELDLPYQTEFARKETLYMRILDHLNKGKAYEIGLSICKELQHEYETKTFSYTRLSELLVLQSSLYANIIQADRKFGEFYRVAFFGTRFPQSVCGKQFVYRGNPGETFQSFVEKMLNKHPSAQLITTSTIPSQEVQYGEGQYLQITHVNAEPDPTSPIFCNPDVPPAVRAYYEFNETNVFTFSRNLDSDSGTQATSKKDFASLWIEKTSLICEDAFPTVLRRSEIVEIRITEISPIENALLDIEAQHRHLATLERHYRALSLTRADTPVNTISLSQALNEIVDVPDNQGIPAYRRTFLSPEFVSANPDKQRTVAKMEQSIDELAVIISQCLKLHGLLAPPEMLSFHDALVRFFDKNFPDEIARLVPGQTYPVSSPSSQPALQNAPTPTQGPDSTDLGRRNSFASVLTSTTETGFTTSTAGGAIAIPRLVHAIPPAPVIIPPASLFGRPLEVVAESHAENGNGSSAASYQRSGSGNGEDETRLRPGFGNLTRKGVLGSLKWKRRSGSSNGHD